MAENQSFDFGPNARRDYIQLPLEKVSRQFFVGLFLFAVL